MNILFRADSSSSIGTGHIMRDLVLAKQYANDDITFAVRNLSGNINNKIDEAGHKKIILKTNNFEELNSLIQKLSIDMIVIDHYDIDYDFEKKLKKHNTNLKIFVFDDTHEKHYCDVLLNHNIYANEEMYKNLVPQKCELRCGAKYTLLRDEFLLEKQKGRKNMNDKEKLNVFIAMGGADHSNKNIKILEVLKGFANLHAHVVTTSANSRINELENFVKQSDNVTLYINTNQIAKLMNEAAFAIITPSVTINEIFYLNVPFIAIKTADNQNLMYDYLKDNHYLVCESYSDEELLSRLKQITKAIK